MKEAAIQKRELFLNRLRELGFMVVKEPEPGNRENYLLRGAKEFPMRSVNIRTTSLEKPSTKGRKYWYNAVNNTLILSDFVIYLTTGPYYGFCIPSKILRQVYDRMYISSDDANSKTFSIAWDDERIYFSDGSDLNLQNYYFRLEETEDNPILLPGFH